MIQIYYTIDCLHYFQNYDITDLKLKSKYRKNVGSSADGGFIATGYL